MPIGIFEILESFRIQEDRVSFSGDEFHRQNERAMIVQIFRLAGDFAKTFLRKGCRRPAFVQHWFAECYFYFRERRIDFFCSRLRDCLHDHWRRGFQRDVVGSAAGAADDQQLEQKWKSGFHSLGSSVIGGRVGVCLMFDIENNDAVFVVTQWREKHQMAVWHGAIVE